MCIQVGAGFAGLYAARLLRNTFPDLRIVEANEEIGGRVKEHHGLVSWPVQEGPEYVSTNLLELCSILQ